MKLEKLKSGQVFKNYKEMCLDLEMDIKSSTDSKKAQYKELARYCDYQKDGHKILIKSVYENPLPKIENRGKSEGSRRSIYGNTIQLLIADLLAQSDGYISISRNKLLASIGIVNSNFGECGQHLKKLSKYAEMDERVIYDFYNTNNSNFRSMIESALNNLEDKRVIMYSTVTKVHEKGKYSPRIATQEEITQIMKYEKDTLEQMGFKQISEVRVSKKWKQYQRKVQQLLIENTDIEFHFSAYEITVNKNYIEQERNELADLLLEQVVRDDVKNNLNSTIIENIIKNAQIRYEKGFTNGKMAKVRQNQTYIENIKKLANLLIDKNTPNITASVRNTVLEELPLDLLDEVENQLMELFG
ncbi:hypothetical protein QFZ31_005755 [Neobacillus niacini]|uniref:hypothetical protein n=1 Tax=Neobacillus driksii TaxID=3035913 RepID=UPI00277E97F3|nr:hypothetical protein [Neobacillus niacini]MDQ0975877.1 hypothetical protein [Neobacillus niacini]